MANYNCGHQAWRIACGGMVIIRYRKLLRAGWNGGGRYNYLIVTGNVRRNSGGLDLNRDFNRE